MTIPSKHIYIEGRASVQEVRIAHLERQDRIGGVRVYRSSPSRITLQIREQNGLGDIMHRYGTMDLDAKAVTELRDFLDGLIPTLEGSK